MFNANAFTVRVAREADEPTLAWLGALAGQPAPRRPALIGHIDGMPAAAMSLLDGRVVEDPYCPAHGLAAHLRLHRSGWRPRRCRDAVRKQLRAALPFMV
jgi:hypothetical protein